jgi:hypothetical protein
MHGIAPRFPFLAQAPHCFPQAHCERRNRFEPPLAALGHAAIILSLHFRKQQLCVAQDSRQWIIELVTQHFAKILIAGAVCILSFRFRKARCAVRQESCLP